MNISKGRKILALLFSGMLALSLGMPAQAATPLQLKSKTPAEGGGLGGVASEISLTFNQPVEVFDNGGKPQIFFLIDHDGDGRGDDVVAGGEAGAFRGVLEVSAGQPEKVLVRVNDKLEASQRYVLIISPSIRVKGSGAANPDKSDQVFAGIGVPKEMRGWSFNTKGPGEEKADQKTPAEEEEEAPEEKSDTQAEIEEKEKEAAKAFAEQLIKRIKAAKKGDRIKTEIISGARLTAPILDALREKEDVTLDFYKKVLSISMLDGGSSSLEYTISLNSDTVTAYKEDFSLSLPLSFMPQSEQEILRLKDSKAGEKYMLIHIDHQGALPGDFTIVFKDPAPLRGAGSLYLYRYNEEREALEDASAVRKEGGDPSFVITRGSDYLLTDTPLAAAAAAQTAGKDSAGQDRTVRYFRMVGLAVIMLSAVSAGLIYKRRKTPRVQ